MLRIYDVTTDYQKNPVGVATEKPRFSWKLKSDRHPFVQGAYQIQVACDKELARLVWDSGQVASNDSIQVEYGGDPLASDQKYYLQVSAWDGAGSEKAVSEASSFSTSILDRKLLRGAFITTPGNDMDESSCAYLFRKEFSVGRKVARATLYATSKGLYEAGVNGRKAKEAYLAPGWTDYSSRLLFQAYDVTESIVLGGNVIYGYLGVGWYKGEIGAHGLKQQYGKTTALFMQLNIHYEDGTSEEIVTDGTWKYIQSPVTFAQIYHGETYDASLEQPGFAKAGFIDSSWGNAVVESADMSRMFPSNGPFVTAHEIIKPQKLAVSAKGERILDFGQNLAGIVRFKARGRKGDRVVLQHSELLYPDGTFATENLMDARQTVEYLLKGEGEEAHEPRFTFMGFRYVHIKEWPGEISLEDFESVALYSDMRPVGAFACSNALVTKLAQNARWSMKSNFLDVPTDCPQREERLGWTGDACVFSRAASYFYETAPFFRKWLADVESCQRPDGAITHVVPNVKYFTATEHVDYGSAGWGDAGVAVPYYAYKHSGDIGILQNQYSSMKAWIGYVKAHSAGGFIYDTGFHYGDWMSLDEREGGPQNFGATPKELVATAYYAQSVAMMAECARALGKKDDERLYGELLSGIKAAFAKEFFTESGRLAGHTQSAHALALAFGLSPERFRERTRKDMRRLIESSDGHLTTGFLATPHLLYALCDGRGPKEAYDMLLQTACPSWLYQVLRGATTIWERWDAIREDDSIARSHGFAFSFNHYAYGAVADFLFSRMAGLDTSFEKPAFGQSVIAPRPDPRITWASGSIDTPYGPLKSSWTLENEVFSLKISVPENTAAQVVLPFVGNARIPEGFSHAGPDAKAILGSGEHSFSYKITAYD